MNRYGKSELREEIQSKINFKEIGDYDLNRFLQISPVDYHEYLSKTRKQHVVIFKQVGIALMFGSGMTSTLIAEKLSMDHSSIIHSTKKVINMIDTNDKMYLKALEILITDTSGYYIQTDDVKISHFTLIVKLDSSIEDL
jgi:chromosomal replication initiation ATPase DnaA